MSTRSVMVLRSGFDGGMEIARMYRHSDGYPDAFGLDACKALAMMESESEPTSDPRWAQHFLKHLLGMELTVEFEPSGAGAWAHGDLEYVYVVDGSRSGAALAVYEVPFDFDPGADYSRLLSLEPVFRGAWNDFPKWLRAWSAKAYTSGGTVLDEQYDPSRWYCKGASEKVWNALQGLSRAEGQAA